MGRLDMARKERERNKATSHYALYTRLEAPLRKCLNNEDRKAERRISLYTLFDVRNLAQHPEMEDWAGLLTLCTKASMPDYN